MRSTRTVLAPLLVSALLGLVTGCTFGHDDEMAPPKRTLAASPSPDETALPVTVPAGRDVVAPEDVVWASGSRLHVGARSVDLTPVGIDDLVSVPGGVYIVSNDELWYTDLSRLRGTGITGVTHLGVTADATRILVGVGTAGAASTYAFDTTTGRAVSSAGLEPVTAGARLRGPDRGEVAVPRGFVLAGWAGKNTFYGVAGPARRPTSVVSCGLRAKTCQSLGALDGSDPPVFGTGR